MTKEEIDESLRKTLGFMPGDDIFKEDNAKLAEILSDTNEAISAMNLNTVEEKKQAAQAVEKAKEASDAFVAHPTASSLEFAKNSVVAAQDTLNSISEQTRLMSETVQHIYSIIVSSGIVDPDLVSSFAVLVSSAKDLWAMKLDVYKMLISQIHAITMENLKQEHKLEFEERKFELKKKFHDETKSAAIDVGDKKYVFDNSSLLKKISDMKRGKTTVVDAVSTSPLDDNPEPDSESDDSEYEAP